MVTGIILAAGESTRLEGPKALFPFKSKTIIRCVVDSLMTGGISPIEVVLGAHAGVIRPEATGLNARVVTDDKYRTGQLSSLQKGLEVVRESPVSGVVVHPVDHPAVKPEIVKAILKCFATFDAPVVVPTYNGRRGHPMIFSAKLFDELVNAPAEIGARAVVWRHGKEVVEVATDDCAVIQNIGTPKDYDILL